MKALPDGLKISSLVSLWLLCEPAGAEAPPGDLVDQLTSEHYPVREAAGRELMEWAADHGQAAKAWLAEQSLGADDAELQQRSLEVLQELVLSELALDRPGFVGINMRSVPVEAAGEVGYGVAVLEVVEGSPADKAGIKSGNIILKLNGKGWKDATANDRFAAEVGELRGGDTVNLTVVRGVDAEKEDLKVTLAPRPWKNGVYPLGADFRGFTQQPFMTEKEAEKEVFREWFANFRSQPPN